MQKKRLTDLIVRKSNVKKELFHDKYFPETIEQFIGNRETIDALNEYILNPDRKIGFIIGPSGCGKNSIVKLVIKQQKFNHIQFDILSMEKRKNFFSDLSKIFKIHNNSKTLISIVNVDSIFGEKLFSRIVSLIRNTTCTMPIVFISNTRYVQKNYMKQNMIKFILEYPPKDLCIKFCTDILKKEACDVSKNAIVKVVEDNQCNVKVILNVLQIMCVKKEKKLTIRDINKLTAITKKDQFFYSSEFMTQVFDHSSIEFCTIVYDQTFNLDLFLSNIPNANLPVLDCSYLYELLSMSAHLEHYRYKTHEFFMFKHYYMFMLITMYKLLSKNKKVLKLRKNAFNNLHSIQRKNCTKKKVVSRFNLPWYEQKFIEEYKLN